MSSQARQTKTTESGSQKGKNQYDVELKDSTGSREAEKKGSMGSLKVVFVAQAKITRICLMKL